MAKLSALALKKAQGTNSLTRKQEDDMQHSLNTSQLVKLIEATKGGYDWPEFTNNAKVNYAIDCMTALVLGDEEPEFDDSYYEETAHEYGWT